jgi:predicted nucleic acid-binding protein
MRVVRRELLRAKKNQGIERLDALTNRLEYLPITTAAMFQAAQFWAQARQQGQPTADNQALDGDVILAAQAVVLNIQNVVIATTNVGHLSRFTDAKLWQEISVVQSNG